MLYREYVSASILIFQDVEQYQDTYCGHCKSSHLVTAPARPDFDGAFMRHKSASIYDNFSSWESFVQGTLCLISVQLVSMSLFRLAWGTAATSDETTSSSLALRRKDMALADDQVLERLVAKALGTRYGNVYARTARCRRCRIRTASDTAPVARLTLKSLRRKVGGRFRATAFCSDHVDI